MGFLILKLNVGTVVGTNAEFAVLVRGLVGIAVLEEVVVRLKVNNEEGLVEGRDEVNDIGFTVLVLVLALFVSTVLNEIGIMLGLVTVPTESTLALT